MLLITQSNHGRKPGRTEQLCLLAVRFLEGTAKPSATQAAALAGVSASYVSTLRHASPQERYAVACGKLTLSELHNRKRHSCPTDAAVERAIKRLGPDRVLRVLDKMTTPPPPPMMMQAAE